MAALSLVFELLARDRASADLRRVGDAADDVGRKADGAGRLFGGLGKAVVAGVAVAGVAVVGLGASAIGAASDLEQTRIKIGNVFGPEASKIVQGFAKNAATSLGISQAAALDAAGTFGTFFTQLGFTQDQSAKTSGEVIKLAADLGSFNNLPTAEVLDAINSSLRGEFDSLQRLVPTINAAAVEQEALAASGKTAASALTAQEKATATLALITKGSALALDDFSESSGTLAIKQQQLKAKFEDAKAALGNALLPAATGVATFFTDKFVPAVERLVEQFRTGEGAGGALTNTFKALSDFLRDQVGPRLLIIAGFVRDEVLPRLRDLGGYIRDTVLPLLRDFAEKVLERVRAGLETLRTKIQENRPQLEALAVLFKELMQFLVERGLPILGRVAAFLAGELFRSIGSVIDALGTIIRVSGNVLSVFLGMVSGMLGGIQSVLGGLAKLPGPFQDTFRKAAESVGGTKAGVDALKTGLDRLPVLTKVQVNGETGIAQGGVEAVNRSLRNLPPLTRVSVDADTGPARRETEALLRFVNSQRGAIRIAGVGGSRGGVTAGDGPGAGGPMLARVSRMIAGTGMRVTSTYRTPARNAAVGGSPRSYHLDRGNPAVDVVGPAGALDRLQGQLRAAGGLRELLWRVPGHYDHLHVAHEGGMISSSWPTLPGLRSDERPLIGQVGERVLSKTEVASGGGQTVNNYAITTPALDSFGLVNLLKRMEMLNA